MLKEELTSRERVRLALEHKATDRVPLDLGGTFISTLTLGAYDHLKQHLAATEGLQVTRPPRIINKWGQTVRPDEEVLQRLHIDTRSLYSKAPLHWRDLDFHGGIYVDEWGVLRRRSDPGPYFYYDVVGNPLENATDLIDIEKFRWPDGADPGRIIGLREEAEHLYNKTSYALVGNLMGVDIFEICWFVRGFEQFLVDLALDPEFAHALMRKITDIQKRKFELFLGAVGEFLDVVVILDDVATQRGLLISPATYQTMIQPYHKELISFIKARTPAKLLYHSCGAVAGMLDQLLEAGIDIIQPVQVGAEGMDSAILKARFGERVVFWGGIDTQHVLPQGSPDDVREEVEHRITDFGGRGGYVLGAVHNIQVDVPPINVVTMYDHAREFSLRMR